VRVGLRIDGRGNPRKSGMQWLQRAARKHCHTFALPRERRRKLQQQIAFHHQ